MTYLMCGKELLYGSPTLIGNFTFHGFSYSCSTVIWKYQTEKWSDKEFMSFELCAILCNMMRSHSLLLHPSPDMKSSFVSVPALCIQYAKVFQERERQRDHSHIPFIVLHCFSSCILLLTAVVTLLYIIFNLNFIIGMYV